MSILSRFFITKKQVTLNKKKLSEPTPITKTGVAKPSHSVTYYTQVDSYLSDYPFRRKVLDSLSVLIGDPILGTTIDLITRLVASDFDVFISTKNDGDLNNIKYEIEKLNDNLSDLGYYSTINRMITQLAITGVLSNSINLDYSYNNRVLGIKNLLAIDPKTIDRYVKDDGTIINFQRYSNFDRPIFDLYAKNEGNDFVKLNPLLYSYKATLIIGNNPIGIPPLLKTLPAKDNYHRLLNKITTEVNDLSLTGIVSMLSQKPIRGKTETKQDYLIRARQKLKDQLDPLIKSLKSGVFTGFKGVHEFDMQPTTGGIKGMLDLLEIYRREYITGTLFHQVFFGSSAGGLTQSVGRLVFNNADANFNDIGNTIAELLKTVYLMQIRLKLGIVPKIMVKPKKSKLTDNLRAAQAYGLEIKNNIDLFNQGLISQDQLAEKLGLKEPDINKPRIIFNQGNVPIAGNPEDNAQYEEGELEEIYKNYVVGNSVTLDKDIAAVFRRHNVGN